MCFSATASFGAAAVLGIIGVASLFAVRQGRYYAFALIPVFFALQQVAEGMVWVSHGLQPLWVYIYLCFVLIIWPIWMPLSVWLIETNQKRTAILLGWSIFGTVLASIYSIVLWKHGVAVLLSHHIRYEFLASENLPIFTGAAAYLLAVIGACLISSKGLVNILGGVSLLSAIITYGISIYWFTSLWCYFGSIISCGVYGIIRFYNKSLS